MSVTPCGGSGIKLEQNLMSVLKQIFFADAFQVVRTATGACTETMTRKTWDVQEFLGQSASVKLVDISSGGWGHINFDDLKGDISCAA